MWTVVNGERPIIFYHVRLVPWITYMMLLNLKDTFSAWESQFVTKLLQVQNVVENQMDLVLWCVASETT